MRPFLSATARTETRKQAAVIELEEGIAVAHQEPGIEQLRRQPQGIAGTLGRRLAQNGHICLYDPLACIGRLDRLAEMSGQ